MEFFLGITLTAVLSIKTVDWDTPFPSVKYSNSLTVITLVLVGVIPLLLGVLYCINFPKLRQDDVKSNYDAGLDGTKLHSTRPSKSVLVYPMQFFARRIVFVVSAIFLGDYIWAQLTIQMTVTVLSAAYMLHFRPLDSPFANRIEVMNECTILALSYHLLGFTDLVPDAVIRNKIGFSYMGVTLLNIGVHLIFLVWNSIL